MGQMPGFTISENAFADLETNLRGHGLCLVCVEKQHLQRDQKTMYRGWEVRSGGKPTIIMWDKHRVDRPPGDSTVELTLGSPAGRKGLPALEVVIEAIVAAGGKQYA
jgi:hypothetical protein